MDTLSIPWLQSFWSGSEMSDSGRFSTLFKPSYRPNLEKLVQLDSQITSTTKKEPDILPHEQLRNVVGFQVTLHTWTSELRAAMGPGLDTEVSSEDMSMIWSMIKLYVRHGNYCKGALNNLVIFRGFGAKRMHGEQRELSEKLTRLIGLFKCYASRQLFDLRGEDRTLDPWAMKEPVLDDVQYMRLRDDIWTPPTPLVCMIS